MEEGAEAPAPRRPRTGLHVFSDEEAWDVLEDIPNDSAAALILIEHHWAVPLRDAIARAGGFRISDGFISPLDLVEIGLHHRRGGEGAPRHGAECRGRITWNRRQEETRDDGFTQGRAAHLSARGAPTLDRGTN